MTLPNWYGLILLSLAAFRVYRLLAEDTILDRPRRWLVRLPYDWKEGRKLPEGYREKWAIFITCPWCAGFWISLAWWGVYQITPRWTLIFAVPWAISALLALAAKNLDET